nr:unnamed protein product [Spirometra erinaceieuropaei]
MFLHFLALALAYGVSGKDDISILEFKQNRDYVFTKKLYGDVEIHPRFLEQDMFLRKKSSQMKSCCSVERFRVYLMTGPLQRQEELPTIYLWLAGPVSA